MESPGVAQSPNLPQRNGVGHSFTVEPKRIASVETGGVKKEGGMFPSGDVVAVRGLVQAQRLNGELGTIDGYNETKDRFVVTLATNGIIKLLKEENLVSRKKPPTAYFIFVAEKRPTLKGTVGEITKQLCTLWSASEKDEKDAYEDKAFKLKAKYDIEAAILQRSPSSVCSTSS